MSQKKRKLHLQYDEVLNGAFTPQKINLLFTFQVNCPGCFAYGFPMVSQLQSKFDDRIGYLGLSTAFEDYDLNTLEHTKRLVESGYVVGETEKMLKSRGFDKYPNPIRFPVAMDHAVTEPELQDNTIVDHICQINPDFNDWTAPEQDLLRQKVRNYLEGQNKISFTFTVNQFRGTPTFVIFNDSMEILHEWFGHVAPARIENSLTAAIEAYEFSI